MFWRALCHVSLLLPALAAGGAVSAEGNASRDFGVKSWTTENRLPQNRISAIKQTRDGYLWLGTWFGVARFDGINFTVFNKLNTPEMVEDTIMALAEAVDGTLWMGTKNGLVGYREGRFQRLTTADGL